MIRKLCVWVWERRLAHARALRARVAKDWRNEMRFAQAEVEYCETMASRARIAAVESRADKALARGH